MIVCTSSVDTLVRQAFGRVNKNFVNISSIQKMMNDWGIDPDLHATAREAYIISDADVTKKLRDQILQAAAKKHPDVVIIFVARKGKTDIQQGNGINAVLSRPKAEELADTVFGVIEGITEKASVVSSADSVPVGVEGFRVGEGNTDEFGRASSWDTEEKPVEEVTVDNLESVDLPVIESPAPIEEPVVVEEPTSDMVTRIKECNRVAEVARVTREITSGTVIKELIDDNMEYTNIESRLKGITEKIYAVYADPTIRSEEEKLDKVKALLYDKDYYEAKANTIIEQRVEELISTVVDKTKECLQKRLDELDEAIVNLNVKPANGFDYAGLAGLTDARANILLELQVLDKEVRDIFGVTNKVADDMSTKIANNSSDLTGHELLNARLRLTGESVVSDKSIEAILGILNSAEDATGEFKTASRSIVIMMQKLNKLIELDKEQIAMLSQTIQFLRANNVEDTIIKETLIKKSMRIFVGKEGTGRSTVPYVLSKIKSRQNCNVLYMDLTGTCKTRNYGEEMYSYEDWFANRYEKEFCAVEGKIPDTVEAAQSLMVALTKAADYYRVINVVLDPSQKALFDVMAPDVLTINYIVEGTSGNLDFFREFIKDTSYDNVAQRVIINKCVTAVCNPIIGKLGLVNNLNVHVTTIPYIPALVECALREIKPYELENVKEAFREASKVC